MIEKFWETIGENLAGEWNFRQLGPVLVFWGGGLVIWLIRVGFSSFSWLFQLTAAQTGLLIIVALVIVLLSNFIINNLILPLLRLFEGYWTLWPFNHLRLWLTSLLRKRWENQFSGEYQRLAKAFVTLDPVQAQRLEHLDTELITAFPKQPNLFLPTLTGNMLRAAEEYPQFWYGLQVEITWPRLWLLLPEGVQNEITLARQELDTTASWIVWSVLFSLWVGFSWWVVVISVLVAFFFCRRLYATGRVYGQLLCSAYDIHRLELYRSLGWPLPKNPADERIKGENLTQYLRRRQTPANLKYQQGKS